MGQIFPIPFFSSNENDYAVRTSERGLSGYAKRILPEKVGGLRLEGRPFIGMIEMVSNMPSMQIPSLKTQALISGMFGIRQTAAERLFAFQVQRIMQEEVRIEHQKIQASHQISAINARLALIDAEIDPLP